MLGTECHLLDYEYPTIVSAEFVSDIGEFIHVGHSIMGERQAET